LVYPWTHPDPSVDQLYDTVLAAVTEAQAAGLARGEIFDRVWLAAGMLRWAKIQPSPPRSRFDADSASE
jgi:hypothetical protein